MRQPNELPDSLKTINVKAILRKRGIYTKLRINREMKEQMKPLARKAIEGKKKPKQPKKPQIYAQFTNDQAKEYWEKQIHIVEVIEAKFDHKIQQFINKMVTGFLKHLESEISEKTIKKINTKGYFDDNEDALLTEAQLDFTPLLMDQAVLAGQEAYKLIRSKDIYLPDQIRATVADNVKRFTQSMLDTDRDKLINIISQGLDDGKSVPEIRSAIQADFEGEYTKMQAQRITRTEVLRASNQATLDAYEQSGVVEGKQWLTAGAVDECAEYEGQIESLGGNFYSDTSDFADGDPPLHPNCRCVLLPVLIGEKAYAPQPNKELYKRVEELEGQIDKRTKAYKELKSERIDDQAYIKALEKYLGDDEPNRED